MWHVLRSWIDGRLQGRDFWCTVMVHDQVEGVCCSLWRPEFFMWLFAYFSHHLWYGCRCWNLCLARWHHVYFVRFAKGKITLLRLGGLCHPSSTKDVVYTLIDFVKQAFFQHPDLWLLSSIHISLIFHVFGRGEGKSNYRVFKHDNQMMLATFIAQFWINM